MPIYYDVPRKRLKASTKSFAGIVWNRTKLRTRDQTLSGGMRLQVGKIARGPGASSKELFSSRTPD